MPAIKASVVLGLAGLSTRCLAWSRVITQSPAMIALEPKERAVCVNVAIIEAWLMPTYAEYLTHCWALHWFIFSRASMKSFHTSIIIFLWLSRQCKSL